MRIRKLFEKAVTSVPILGRVPEMYGRWQDHGGNLLAAAVAYYAALSFFPLLLVLIAGVGLAVRLTQWGADARQQVLNAIAEYASQSVRDDVEILLGSVESGALSGGPMGLLMLLLTSLALFAHFDRALDRIWRGKPPEEGTLQSLKRVLTRRLRGFLILVLLGTLVLIVFAASLVLSSLKSLTDDVLPLHESVWWIIEIAFSLTLNTCVFASLHRYLPPADVRWKDAFQGGLLTAAMWELGRLLLASFVIGERYGAYGIVGSFIAVLLWVYFASTVVFLGAEYVHTLGEIRAEEKR